MAWFPTKESINQEVADYNNISFFKKSKNLLVCFIIFTILITVLLKEGLNLVNYTVIIVVAYNSVLASFIYYNHRWAMVIFSVMFTLDKILFILNGQSLVPNLIFGVLAIILTITAYRVSSDLKKLNG